MLRGKQKRNAMTSQGVNVCSVTAIGHIKQYLSMQANCESSRKKSNMFKKINENEHATKRSKNKNTHDRFSTILQRN